MAAPPQLKISGSQIVNASTSCTVRLKGVDVSSLERNGEDLGDGPPSGGITATVAFAIKNWKCNYIRLPLNQDSWFIYDYSYRNLVDSIVNICSQNGAYVILDLHWSGLASTASAPVTGAGWLTSTGQQEMPDANSVTFWSSVAARYANNPAVLFDLYNEPNGVSGSVWRNGGSAGVFNTPGLQALLTAVRNTGANNVVIAGGLNYCQTFTGILDSGLALTDTASGNGVLYDAHIYSGNYGISTGSWNTNVATYTSAHAVMVGEFGPGPTSNINDGGAFDAAFIPWLNGTGDTGNYVFSATAWSMNTTDQPNLISDWNFTTTSYHGAPVSTWLAAGGYGCAPTPGGPTYTPTATPVPASCWNLQNFTEDSFYNNTNGQWFTYDWTTASNTPVTPAMSTVSCPGGVPCAVIMDNSIGAVAPSSYSAHVTGGWACNGCVTDGGVTTYAGFALATEMAKGYSNMSWVTNVAFYVQSTVAGVTLRCNLNNPTVAVAPLSWQGSLVGGGGTDNQYGFDFTVNTANTWQYVSVPINAFECQDWGPGACPPVIGGVTYTLAQAITWVSSIQWETEGSPATFGFWIDNVCLAGSPFPPTATPSVVASTNTFTPTPSPTRTLTSTPTSSPTFTLTRTSTASPTNTMTGTATFTATRTTTPTSTSTVANTPTNTNTSSPTATTVNTSTRTATASPTNSPTATLTSTLTNTMTNTAVNTATKTATLTPTITLASTATSTPTSTASRTTTSTATVTPTNTPVNSSTATATKTPVSTSTNTATSTLTSTSTLTPSLTPSPTGTLPATSTPTYTPTVTLSSTPSPTPTRTATDTATDTATRTATSTATGTPTNTLVNTATPTSTLANTATSTTTNSATGTATKTSTSTATGTPTSTFAESPTNTATATPTNTLVDTATKTTTSTATLTATPSFTASRTTTSTATNSPVNTDTPTSTLTLTPTFTPTPVTVSATQGTNPPAPSTQIPGAAGVTIQQIQLTNPGVNVVTLTSLTLTENGPSSAGINSVSLVQNGTIISTATFSGSTATFSLTGATIAANNGTATYQVVVNFSNSVGTGSYPFSISGAAGTNGQPVLFSGLPVTGSTVTIVAATPTPSSTPNFTTTSTATATPPAVSTPAIFPNPSNGTQPVTVAVTLNQPSDTLTVQIFTVAFRKVQDNVVSTSSPGVQASLSAGTAAKTWYVPLSLNDKWGTPLASGLYYVLISNHSGYRSVSKLLLLR